MSDIKNTIDSEQILSIISQLEDDIQELQQLYLDGRDLDSWLCWLDMSTGSTNHRAIVERFRAYYSKRDYDLLTDYIKFLRGNVAKSDWNSKE